MGKGGMMGDGEGRGEGRKRGTKGGRKDFPGLPIPVSPAPILHTFTRGGGCRDVEWRIVYIE